MKTLTPPHLLSYRDKGKGKAIKVFSRFDLEPTMTITHLSSRSKGVVIRSPKKKNYVKVKKSWKKRMRLEYEVFALFRD